MTKVFISYRRQDSDAFADAIYEEFERRLGASGVFLDVKGIESGEHYPTALRRRVAEASTVLVLVGSGWLNARDSKGRRRLDNEDDWVRIELSEAFAQKKRVIPVLVRGARMPLSEELPQDIRQLAERNAFTLQNLLIDVPRLGGIVEGRLSVAEPIVIMAYAASFAFSERASQRMKARPFSSGDSELSALAAIVGQYYNGVGTAIYYAILVLGVLIALRARIGWRMEEMLRISLCTAVGVGVGYLLSVPLAVFGTTGPITTALRLGLWFLGLSAGTLYGIRKFAPLRPTPNQTVILMCIAIAGAAFGGSLLQHFSTEWLQLITSLQGSFSRTAFWGPIVLTGALLWWQLESTKVNVSMKEISFVLLPLILAMLGTDAISIMTSFVPYASGKDELQKVMQDKQAQDNAIFFAVMAGVSAWRINRLLQQRDTTKLS